MIHLQRCVVSRAGKTLTNALNDTRRSQQSCGKRQRRRRATFRHINTQEPDESIAKAEFLIHLAFSQPKPNQKRIFNIAHQQVSILWLKTLHLAHRCRLRRRAASQKSFGLYKKAGKTFKKKRPLQSKVVFYLAKRNTFSAVNCRDRKKYTWAC